MTAAKKTVLIVDGDMLAYAAVSGCVKETEWEPFMWTYTLDLNEAIASYDRSLERLAGNVEPDEIIVALTSATNFRRGIYPPYKSGRSKKPVGYAAFREHLLQNEPGTDCTWDGLPYSVWMRDGLEGDDIIGILMTRSNPSKDVRVLWSGDKDLKQIPGLRVNKDGTVSEVTADDADHFHAMQTLTGDITDGYPGCPKFGPVSAAKLLGKIPVDGWWPAIEGAYVKAGLTREDMLVQARCARILQASDYNFKTKEPIPWNPPG